LRIHAEEFSYLGGARMAAGLGATTVDHLQHLPESDFEVLKAHRTIPVMTPGTSFFLRLDRYAPARGLIEAGLPLALGSDFNAGSNLSESMQMAMSLAVLRMKLTPEEALVAATVNAAHALRRGSRVGSLEVGKQADILVVSLRDIREWPYHYGVNLVEGVYKKGRKQ
jgi:imidazolonepropionase